MHFSQSRLLYALMYAALLNVCAGAQYSSKVKVMTYNIDAQGHGSGSYEDIAGVIREIDPDICGLQKLDSCNSRNPLHIAKWLGDTTGRAYTFAPALKNFQGGTGSYGVGFLISEPPLTVRKLWIERTSAEEDRGVLEIGVTMGGMPARVIVTHLAHEGAAYRSTQIGKILTWIDSGGTSDPVVIMADFNASANESSMNLLEQAGFEYVRGKNGVILDTTNGINHILYRPKELWKLIDAGNPRYNASNRNPVWADLELLTAASVHSLPALSERQSEKGVTFMHGYVGYTLEADAEVSLDIFDMKGRLVSTLFRKERQERGNHIVAAGKDLAADGIYVGLLSIRGSMPVSGILNWKNRR